MFNRLATSIAVATNKKGNLTKEYRNGATMKALSNNHLVPPKRASQSVINNHESCGSGLRAKGSSVLKGTTVQVIKLGA